MINQNSDYLTPQEAAAYARTTVSTLNTYRCKRKGPKFIKRGRSILCRRFDLDLWLNEGLVDTSGDADA